MMTARTDRVTVCEGGDPPCWSHLLDTRADIVDRDDIDLLVRTFDGPRAQAAKVRDRKMAAAMERLLSGTSADGAQPIEPIWRRPDGG